MTFSLPLHKAHVDEWDPEIKKYLGLAPGWRSVIAEDDKDAWFDEQLLDRE
ncbi:immunity protein Imm33 domain-containing protein [Paenibacillus sp. MABNR03]|uniref:immunity protein Imm33 domain-containing protein n=1 Tax=Paenibacillus sp. MABNR03 TaxID=3142626 RepID=UPI003D26CB18